MLTLRCWIEEQRDVPSERYAPLHLRSPNPQGHTVMALSGAKRMGQMLGCLNAFNALNF